MTFTQDSISTLVKGLRLKGKRIVFTNGVFDILHFGHVDYLTKARGMGDVLIVGLNSDRSVKKFKAISRPYQEEHDRALILSSLRAVDYIIVFSDETPQELIEMIKPDILVKGADYEESEIVGAEFVKSYGGRVNRVELVEGRSTTNIIQKIKESRILVKAIKPTDQIEDLVKAHPQLNSFLISKGVNCIVCGEPAWGTIGEFLERKGFDPDDILSEINRNLGLV